jgi:hypothetical protein
MADINYVDPIEGKESELDFVELVTLIKGSSIKSLAIADDFFELGLTDAFNLRIQGRIRVSLLSTLNKGELPPVRLQILKDGEIATAQAVEKRLHALRQLYAVTFLLNAGKANEIANIKQPESFDFEDMLREDERLFITAAGPGSFDLTFITKTLTALKSLGDIASLFYNEGRQALLERVRSTTELKKLDVVQKQDEIALKRLNATVDLVQKIAKIKDPNLRQQTEALISTHLRDVGKPPLSLPPPSPDLSEDRDDA